MQYKSVKGMSDIVPPDIGLWQFIEQKARDFFGARLYEEIRTPILEYTDLFTRSIGEVSDIVNKEMYSLQDRAGRSLTLRPEMTASVIRSVIENNLLTKREPLKLFYIGPMFRAERPQAGRRRQFFQIGVEIIGNNVPFCDAEVIKDLALFLKTLGLSEEEFQIKLNNLGCPKCRPPYLSLLRDFFSEKKNELCADCSIKLDKNVLRIFDCKNETCKAFKPLAPKVIDHVCDSCNRKFEQISSGLADMQIPFVIDREIVRGLDYYTGAVFEVTSKKLGAQDALGAGGRYDNLMQELGGPAKSAVGFALGIERLLLALEDTVLARPDVLSRTVYIAYGKSEYISLCQTLMGRLERNNIPTYADLDERSLKAQLRRANKFGFRWVLLLNEGNVEKEELILKDMQSQDGIQQIVVMNDLERFIDQIISK